MKKKSFLLVGAALLCMVVSGCGKGSSKDLAQQVQTTVVPTEEASKSSNLVDMEKVDHTEEVETNVIGTKTDSATKVTIINKTGSEVSTLYIRPNTDDDDEWGDELIEDAFTLKNGEQAVYYYEKDSSVSAYDIRIGYTQEDKNECFFRKLPLNTITQITLCMDGTGESGIPYALYLTGSSTKEISTLNDVKKRLGLLDEEEEDEEEDQEETDSNETDEPDDTASNGTDGDEEQSPIAAPEDDNEEELSHDDLKNQPDNPILSAESCIGQPLSTLIGICGEPNGTTYEDEPETGETGYHYYDGFTVSTTVDEDGNEVVAGVW
jgi:hypothetical protein